MLYCELHVCQYIPGTGWPLLYTWVPIFCFHIWFRFTGACVSFIIKRYFSSVSVQISRITSIYPWNIPPQMKPLTKEPTNWNNVNQKAISIYKFLPFHSFLIQSLSFLWECLLVVESTASILTGDKNPEKHWYRNKVLLNRKWLPWPMSYYIYSLYVWSSHIFFFHHGFPVRSLWLFFFFLRIHPFSGLMLYVASLLLYTRHK